MGEAFGDHRASPAKLFGSLFAPEAGMPTLAVWRKEHRRIDAAATSLCLPEPDVRVRSRQTLGISHGIPPITLVGIA
jgi:hypothetical protein